MRVEKKKISPIEFIGTSHNSVTLNVYPFYKKNLSNFVFLLWKIDSPICHNVLRYKLIQLVKQYLYDSSRKKSKDNPLSTRIWCFALVECLAFERRMVDVPPIPFSSCYVSGHALSLCSTKVI